MNNREHNIGPTNDAKQCPPPDLHQDSKIHTKMGKMAILLQVWIDTMTNLL